MQAYRYDESDDDAYIIIILDTGERIKLRWGSARRLQYLLNEIMGNIK